MKRKLVVLFLVALGSIAVAQKSKKAKFIKNKSRNIQSVTSYNTHTSEYKNLVNKNISAINHMFDNESNKNKIYVSVNNVSQCDIVVEFKGKGSHSLSVSPKSRNFIMLEKGSYTISSDVCGAEYSSMKTLVKDMEISLTY